MKRFAWVALAAGVILAWAGVGFGQTVDDVLKNMAAKAETIKDLNVSANVTKYDSVFEEKKTQRLELWYKSPDLTRVDTFSKKGPTEVQTQLVIIGKDYILRANPDTHKAELRRIPAEDMKRARESRDDPMTFFQRKPEDLKKDFDVTLVASTRPACVKLILKPKAGKTFEYKCVELDVNRVTWLPDAVRTMSGGEQDDWALYEFTKVLINTSFPDVVFANPPGYVVQEVAKDAPEKKEK